MSLDISQFTFATYAEAKGYCPDDDYEGQDLTDLVIIKNQILRERLKANPTLDINAMRTMIGAGLATRGNHANVLDFGGGGGNHFTIARTALGTDVTLRWNVVETPAMAQKAQILAGDGLNFFHDIEEAAKDLGEIDLVFTSSALQYTPDPIHHLRQLTAVGARHLFITRTGFSHTGERLIGIQQSRLSDNGPGPVPANFPDRVIFYPYVFDPLSLVEDTILSAGYQIRFKTVEEIEYKIKNIPIHLYGYFCVKAA